jgi:hypothetical protein
MMIFEHWLRCFTAAEIRMKQGRGRLSQEAKAMQPPDLPKDPATARPGSEGGRLMEPAVLRGDSKKAPTRIASW